MKVEIIFQEDKMTLKKEDSKGLKEILMEETKDKKKKEEMEDKEEK